MAVDYNYVKFLFWAKNLGVCFQRSLSLGHLCLLCPPGRFRRAARDFGIPATQEQINECYRREKNTALYIDQFLRFLGAEECVSVDYSDFEGASLLHNLNERFPENLRGHFDVVLDGGTLEHIFNFPAALRHSMELVRVGGHMILNTPASNQMGHGFYQTSPELYFRVFSEENGFALRKIVLCEGCPGDAPFYEVKDPALTGFRTELVSPKLMALIVMAQRTADVPILASMPQQSDYAAVWDRHRQAATSPANTPSGLLWRIRDAMNLYWPFWLRSWKQHWVDRYPRGLPTLHNRRHFRRLSYKEICRERSKTAPA